MANHWVGGSLGIGGNLCRMPRSRVHGVRTWTQRDRQRYTSYWSFDVPIYCVLLLRQATTRFASKHFVLDRDVAVLSSVLLNWKAQIPANERAH
jgi:hypothetical protein